MDQPTSGNKKILAIVGLLVIVAVVGIGVTASSGKKADTLTSATATPTVTASTSASASPAVEAAASSSLKDGTYSATGTYNTPGGEESLTLSVTLVGGKITDTSATGSGNDRNSKEYQDMFIQNYKSQVVGKSIADVNLSRVSGSSLTSTGFNKAIDQIETQAKA